MCLLHFVESVGQGPQRCRGLRSPQARLEQGNRDEIFVECFVLNRKKIKGYYRLGHTLALLHRYEEAQAALKKGLTVEPTNADIQARLKEVDALIKKENAKRAKTNMANLTPCMAAKEEGNALYKDGKVKRETKKRLNSSVNMCCFSFPKLLLCTRELFLWQRPTRKRSRC